MGTARSIGGFKDVNDATSARGYLCFGTVRHQLLQYFFDETTCLHYTTKNEAK
jgi:hypothetical protein